MRSPLSRKGRDAEAELNLPPGFRFHPTDEELVVHYLCRKATASHQHDGNQASAATPPPPLIIAEIDLYKHDPWELPEKALFGTKEWYFFTLRDKKYPNGSRPNRAAGSGYWKATGADKPIRPKGTPTKTVGIKKALVFYAGKGGKGIKTNWIMHEYRLPPKPNPYTQTSNQHIAATTFRLEDWVLCRLYNKKNNIKEKIIPNNHEILREEQQRGNGNKNDTTVHSYGAEDSDSFESDDNFPPKSMIKIEDPYTSFTSTRRSMQMEEFIEDDENGRDWFANLSLEDLQNYLAAMPALVPLQNQLNMEF